MSQTKLLSFSAWQLLSQFDYWYNRWLLSKRDWFRVAKQQRGVVSFVTLSRICLTNKCDLERADHIKNFYWLRAIFLK